jgi:hypothetical protein
MGTSYHIWIGSGMLTLKEPLVSCYCADKFKKRFSFCLVQIISAISGGITDLSFHAVGYAWQIINCFLTASYSVDYMNYRFCFLYICFHYFCVLIC